MIMNSTDNILISVILGTVVVGYYSNYVTVFSMIDKVVMIVISAILASIGNFIATQSPDRSFSLFRYLLFYFYALAAFCSSCYLCGMDDFITIWIGEEFVISGGFIFALVFNRYVFFIVHPVWITRESSGVFVSTRYVMLCAAIINIVLSVFLGRVWGVSGIIAATGLSYLLTIFWYEPKKLCEIVFQTSVTNYWKYIAKLMIPTVPVFVTAAALRVWSTTNLVPLLIKFILCFITTVFWFYILFRKSDEIRWGLKIITSTKLYSVFMSRRASE